MLDASNPIQRWRKMKNLEAIIQDYLTQIEIGNHVLLEDDTYIEQMKSDCEAVINTKPELAVKAYQLLATYCYKKGNTEKADEYNLDAAKLGSCTAAIDYSDRSNIALLGIIKAMNNAGEYLASAQEDFNYYFNQLNDVECRKVIEIAESTRKFMEEKELSYTW